MTNVAHPIASRREPFRDQLNSLFSSPVADHASVLRPGRMLFPEKPALDLKEVVVILTQWQQVNVRRLRSLN